MTGNIRPGDDGNATSAPTPEDNHNGDGRYGNRILSRKIGKFAKEITMILHTMALLAAGGGGGQRRTRVKRNVYEETFGP